MYIVIEIEQAWKSMLQLIKRWIRNIAVLHLTITSNHTPTAAFILGTCYCYNLYGVVYVASNKPDAFFARI